MERKVISLISAIGWTIDHLNFYEYLHGFAVVLLKYKKKSVSKKMIPLSWSWYLICSFLDYFIPFRCFYLDAKESDVSELSQMWLFSETALKNEVAESYIIQQLHSLALFQKTAIAVHPWWTPELQTGKWHEKKIRRKQKKTCARNESLEQHNFKRNSEQSSQNRFSAEIQKCNLCVNRLLVPIREPD